MTAIVPDLIPCDRLGNLMGYINTAFAPPSWQENKPFLAELHLEEAKRSISSARFFWRDQDTGLRYPMLLPGLPDLLTTGSITSGITAGWWLVEQRGKNYGIRLATEGELQERL